MARRGRACLVMGLAMGVTAGAASAESRIPLPPGVEPLPERHRVELGAQGLTVDGFTTDMSLEAVERFYEEALPKAGWRMSPLPWQAHQQEVIGRLEEVRRKDRAAADDPELQALNQRFQETQRQMRRQLHASRGAEHVIVHALPMDDQVAVFLNRWSGSNEFTAPVSSVAQEQVNPVVSAASGWPQTNVCCSGEEVPGSAGALPFGLPRFPGAKVIAKSNGSQQDGVTLLVMVPDSPKAALEFYRQQMTSHGWTLMDLDQGMPVAADTWFLMYRNDRAVCGLTFGGGETPGQSLLTIMVTSQPMPPMGRIP